MVALRRASRAAAAGAASAAAARTTPRTPQGRAADGSARPPDALPDDAAPNGSGAAAATINAAPAGAAATGTADADDDALDVVGLEHLAVAGDMSADELALVPPDPRAAAFFDVDNTVMQGASIFHLARGLYARQFFTTRDIAGFAWQQARFRVFGVEDVEHMGRARDRALHFIQGRSVAELRAIGEEVFDDVMSTKVWPGTRALAQLHLDAGQRVWLVTATPVEVADVIAERLGLTGALGTVAESRDGIYTGCLVGEPLHGLAKAEAVRALAVREGLELERCAAYSDSANDIPMLGLVGFPCAINPDSTLRAHARANGWRIRDYRTGRKAARIGVRSVAGVGAATGAVMAGYAARAAHRGR